MSFAELGSPGVETISTGGRPDPDRLMALLRDYEASGRNPNVDGIPDDVQGVMDGLLGASGRDADSEEILPHPQWVVKTLDQDGRKVFINVCGSSRVSLPSSWQHGKMPAEAVQALQRLDRLDESANEALRFPLSASEPREHPDHLGASATVIDCVFNASVVRQARDHRPLKLFLNQLVMAWVASKHGLKLDPQYKLPKMRCFGGDPRPQRIRKDPSQPPLVSEAVDESTPAGVAGTEEPTFALRTSKAKPQPRQAQQGPTSSPVRIQQASQTAAAAAAPSAAPGSTLQHSLAFEGQPVQMAIVTATIAAAGVRFDPATVAVDVCGERVSISLPDQQPYTVTLPFAVSAEGATAAVSATTQDSVLLRLPFRPFKSLYAEMQADKTRQQPLSMQEAQD